VNHIKQAAGFQHESNRAVEIFANGSGSITVYVHYDRAWLSPETEDALRELLNRRYAEKKGRSDAREPETP